MTATECLMQLDLAEKRLVCRCKLHIACVCEGERLEVAQAEGRIDVHLPFCRNGCSPCL